MTSVYSQNPVTDEVVQRIRANGPLTFAEFHELALYWPGGGYYNGRPRIGREGDFYTAPIAHPAFGALVARQLGQMHRLLGRPRLFTVVEAGAGSGRLAVDVVSTLRKHDPELAEALRYVAVDRASSPALADMGVESVTSTGIPVAGWTGCLLANELLDAMPVHRVVMRQGFLRELYVGVDAGGRLVWVEDALSTPALLHRLEELEVVLPEGYRTEVNLGLHPWFAEVGSALDRGYVLLIDYGHEALDLYNAARRLGTLRCYYRHTLGADPLVHVGDQDISVHVDFTSARRAAEAAGLTHLGTVRQSDFLSHLGLRTWRSQLRSRRDLPRAIWWANLRGLDVIGSPQGMGGFWVLVLGKAAPREFLWGISGGAPPPQWATPLATEYTPRG